MWNRHNGMWCRRISLDEGRVAAWWNAFMPAIQEIGSTLSFSCEKPVVVGPRDLQAVSELDIAQLFDFSEVAATGVYASIEGDIDGLLFFAASLPASKALDLAGSAFDSATRLLGGWAAEPWALVDMKSALAETLAAQAAYLDLKIMASADFLSDSGEWKATFAYIPDFAAWDARWQMAMKEAA